MLQNDNQSAPESDNAAEAVNSVEEAKSTVPEVAKTAEVIKEVIADKKSEAVPAFDVQKSYERSREELESLKKSYSEIRRDHTRRAQHESDLQKKLDSLVDMLSKASEKPIDPAQFIRDLQTQGPKAVEAYFNKWIEPVKNQYQKDLEERDNYIFELQRDFSLDRMRNDKANYPDFAALEPTMKEIAEAANCPIDLSRPVDEVYYALYKLAKDRSSEQAVILAKEQGKQETELQLAKEARTAVAGGGKSGSVSHPDWGKMSAEKMREAVAQLHGVADRD